MAVKISRRWRVIGVVVALLVVAFAARSCSTRGSKSTIERGYLDRISVRSHDRVRDVTEKATGALFFGPVTADLPEAVSGPDLTVRKATDIADPFLATIATGVGTSGNGTRCDVLIQRLRKGAKPNATWKLTRAQTAGIAAGRSEAVLISVGCPFST